MSLALLVARGTWLPCEVTVIQADSSQMKLSSLQQDNIRAEICNLYKFVSFAAGSHMRLPEITILTGFA